MKILLPFDGSGPAKQAVSTVIAMAKQGLALEVVLANVQEAANLYELVVAHDPKVIEEVSQAAGHHMLEPGRAMLTKAAIAFESEVRSGDPAQTLIDILESYGCQMVVMGASGASTLRRALLGSVSNELLHSAGVPVMIVRAVTHDAQLAA